MPICVEGEGCRGVAVGGWGSCSHLHERSVTESCCKGHLAEAVCLVLTPALLCGSGCIPKVVCASVWLPALYQGPALATASFFDVTHLSFLQVPQIYWELSTKRVLLMEFVEGGQVNDRDYMEKNQIDVNEVRQGLVLGTKG